jgi:iron complex outermembrane receptor protein
VGPDRRHSTAIFGAVFLVCLIAAPVWAQTAGQLVGTVTDQTGAPLAGATLVLRGTEPRERVTDAAGRFAFTGLPPGEYTLTTELSGFEAAQHVVRIQPGATMALAIILRVRMLDQVVVTASKTGDADVQSMPMAISAVSSEELARLSTRTIEQAAALAPSVTFTQNSSFGQLSIRGIGTNAVNAGADPSAAMYLDGVYLARPAMTFVDFLDLDRVEVLRGPQGTLYGRNAVGGAMNLISRAPTNDREVLVRATAGTFDEWRAEARASGALVKDRLMASASFVRGIRDGYVRDLDHLDHPLGGDDLISARAQLRVIAGRRNELLVSTDVTSQDGTLLTFNKVLQPKPGVIIDNPPDLHEVRTNTLAESELRQSGVTARLTSALTPTTTLVSLFGYRTLDNQFVADADITELDLVVTDLVERQHQFSEELTIAHEGSRLSWVGGLFLFSEDDDQTVWVPQQQAGFKVLLDPRVDASSAAAFGEATIAVTPVWSITAGLRYTHERKRIDNAGGRYTLDTSTAIPGTTYAYADEIGYSAWTPKVGVERKLGTESIAYVSTTRGFKSGGFNLSSTAPGRGFDPEWAWSYEGGVKSELLDGRARLNVAVFHMDYTNLQVQTPIGIGVFDIRNAAAATIRGVEVEAGARIATGLEAGGHLSFLDAAYDRYIAVGPGNVTGDVAGNRLNNAPEWAGRLWIKWTPGIGTSHRLSLSADASAQSTVYYTPFNDAIQRQLPYGLLGVRAEFGPSDQRWALAAIARNLTNAGYVMATFATSPAAFGGRPGAPRQLAIQFSVRR